MCLQINWKAHMVRDLNFIVGSEELSRSQAVTLTYTAKVLISLKQY